ncbi:hypothetical protein OG302_21670 [Streptomyces sp. NBC_01283]|uniref:hypothetical protein n=1 Tax=Streptomyces sp. NBC_01283 TaxID=2903812 RepID=UPI00352CB805|nr:hypothetical protein OG302_21670 [Streptomyces sp. NBC_01283]
MLQRIAAAFAVATVAGVLATGTAVASDGPSSTFSEGRYAGQSFTNMGGPYGITTAGQADGGHRDGSSLDGLFGYNG